MVLLYLLYCVNLFGDGSLCLDFSMDIHAHTHALFDPTVGTGASLQLAGVNQVNKEYMWFSPQKACDNKFQFLCLWGLVVFSACLLSLLAFTAPVKRGQVLADY